MERCLACEAEGVATRGAHLPPRPWEESDVTTSSADKEETKSRQRGNASRCGDCSASQARQRSKEATKPLANRPETLNLQRGLMGKPLDPLPHGLMSGGEPASDFFRIIYVCY